MVNWLFNLNSKVQIMNTTSIKDIINSSRNHPQFRSAVIEAFGVRKAHGKPTADEYTSLTNEQMMLGIDGLLEYIGPWEISFNSENEIEGAKWPSDAVMNNLSQCFTM